LPAPDLGTVNLTSQGVDQTVRLGHLLGELVMDGEVICLSGDLGAGKTAFARGIGAGWGALEAVTSPTFVLIHEHHRTGDGRVLYHVDCYRLQGAPDAWGIGLEDVLHGTGPVVIEWPENIQDALPPEYLWVQLTILGETQRQIAMRARGERYRVLLKALRDTMPGE
jgi:tRNA threonylcarbamoyladenosine biosynthesis protein TsaE